MFVCFRRRESECHFSNKRNVTFTAVVESPFREEGMKKKEKPLLSFGVNTRPKLPPFLKEEDEERGEDTFIF